MRGRQQALGLGMEQRMVRGKLLPVGTVAREEDTLRGIALDGLRRTSSNHLDTVEHNTCCRLVGTVQPQRLVAAWVRSWGKGQAVLVVGMLGRVPGRQLGLGLERAWGQQRLVRPQRQEQHRQD